MNFMKAAVSVLVTLAILQIAEGYSKEAEEALKAMSRYELLQRSTTATVTDTEKRSSILAVFDAATGAAGFWSDSVLQLTYTANRVSTHLVPEMKTKLTELANSLRGIETQSSIAIRDGKIAFNDAGKPIATALQIVVALKGVPTEYYIDEVKELLQNATQIVVNVVKDLTINNSQIFSNVKSKLDQMTDNLNEFTANTLRSRCYPDVLCVEKSFRSVKDIVAESLDVLDKGEDSAANIAIQVDSVTNLKIREEEDKIKKFAVRLLESYNITRVNIAVYYVVQYNPTEKQVQAQMKRASDYINTLSYFDAYYRNTSRNTVFASIYPVIDASNTVTLLKKQYNKTVLSNEVAKAYAMLDTLYAEILDSTPKYAAQIQEFTVQVEQINSSAIASMVKYLEKYINGNIVDLVDFFTVYARIVDTDIPQVLDEAKTKVDALLKQAQQLLPVIRSTFETLKTTLDVKLQKLLQDVIFGIANRLYENANITIADIFLLGSSNLNNTYKYWIPLIDTEIKEVNSIYAAIVAKNYSSFSIQNELVSITKGSLDVLKFYEDVFGADVVKARSIDVVAELTTIPAAEYTDFIKYNQNNMKELFDSKDTYLKQIQALENDRLEFLNAGPLTLENSTSPQVEQNHFNNNRTYQAKLKLNGVLTALKNIKSGLLASETGLMNAARIVTDRVRRTSDEYVSVMHKTAKLKAQNQGTYLPSITTVVKEIKGTLWI